MHVKSVVAQSYSGVVVWKLGKVMTAQVSSSSLDHSSELRSPSPITLVILRKSKSGKMKPNNTSRPEGRGTATAGSDVVQSGRPIFDDFFQHLWPYIGNNTANVVFQMVKSLWIISIDQ
ncbi:hypothetical protein TNCV_3111431 [Trichonephila clavipes]|nr:hypothetical protein TNCV_3111431 [Trichonephila clavipes]